MPSPSGKKNPATGPKHAPSIAAGNLINLSPGDVLRCVRERGITALVIALILCVLLGAYLLRQPKVYQAQARLLFDRNERIVDIAQVVDQSVGAGQNDAMFNTYLAQITSPQVVSRVVSSFSNEEQQRIWRPYLAADASMPKPEELAKVLQGLLAGNTSAQRQGNTFFIAVKVRHRDPQSAALLATRFVRQFIVHQLDRNTIANNSAISFLRDQTEDLRNKAEASERALQDYREKTGMVSLDESRNIVVDRMKSLSSTVTGAQVRRLSIEARLSQAEAILGNSADPLELAATAEFSNLASVQSQIDQLRAQRATMGERYGPRHPAMIDNLRSREALERLRGELVTVAMANLRNQREKALREEQDLRTQLVAAEQESLRLDQMAIQFNVLRREAETNRSTYAQLLNRLNETTITAQLENSNLRIAEEASAPGSPIEPDTRKIIFMLLALGLCVFVAYPVGLELFFNRVRGWADVESYLKLSLLGELPQFKKIPSANLPQILSRGQDDVASEAVRSLYSNYKITSGIDLPKSILVTSTLPSEGKSFIASNLAEAFASHGVRTLLIDTDFRRPTQHRAFQLDNSQGILRWVEGKQPIPADPLSDPDLGLVSVGPNLHILRTGGTTRRATEILGSEAVRSLFESLRRQFDLVLIDTPPAGVFPDALVLAEHADELIYVIRYNHVARPAARRILDRIAQAGIVVTGVVLNLMPSGMGTAGYYSSYGHYGSKYYREHESKS